VASAFSCLDDGAGCVEEVGGEGDVCGLPIAGVGFEGVVVVLLADHLRSVLGGEFGADACFGADPGAYGAEEGESDGALCVVEDFVFGEAVVYEGEADLSVGEVEESLLGLGGHVGPDGVFAGPLGSDGSDVDVEVATGGGVGGVGEVGGEDGA